MQALHLPLDGNAVRSTVALAEALAGAGALTALTLQAGGDVYDASEPLQPLPELHCAALAPALAQLRSLRALAVHDIAIAAPRDLWRALGALSGLHDLRLTFCQARPARVLLMHAAHALRRRSRRARVQIEEAEAEPLSAEVARLHELLVLDLHGNRLLGSGTLVVVRALLALPALVRAELGMNEIDEEYDEEINALRKELRGRGVRLNIEFNSAGE